MSAHPICKKISGNIGCDPNLENTALVNGFNETLG